MMMKKINLFLYFFTKRLIDILISVLALLVAAPILIVTAIAIGIDTRGPVIFSQTRVGKEGKHFKLLKFRSMIPDAEKILYENPKLLAEYQKHSYKIFADPRVTNVGKHIRRYSIDEFPQFINVLKGEMSFVGPRAYRPEELRDQQNNFPETKKYVKTLLEVKPGITGPWQVSGRSEIQFDKRVKIDAFYAERKSLLYDFIIILKTPLAVVKGKGAV